MNPYIPLETALEMLVTAYAISVTVPLAASVAGMAVIEALEARTVFDSPHPEGLSRIKAHDSTAKPCPCR